jgi:hypothetical protein
MWPWGHLAVAYLCFAAYSRYSGRRTILAVPALAVAFGSQFPDLVDKPLAWTFAVLPTGRTLGHSLPFLLVVFAVLWVVAARHDATRAVVAFAIGSLAHLAGDALYPVLDGNPEHARFVLWPLFPPLEYSVEQSFAAHFALVELGPHLLFECVLFALAVVVWRADGYPGLDLVLARIDPRPALK